ncbi:hypothetical protein V6N13_015033 [Hibiscus sabdariffa]
MGSEHDLYGGKQIRVSSRISSSPIILNVDCDMYSNNSESIKYALCIFMDEEKGDEVAYVQFPQNFDNLTKNEIYGSSFRVIQKLEIQGLDANGGPCYVGTGCFHRREALCGKKYDKNYKVDWMKLNQTKASLLEETCKVLASCSFEHNTAWGKEMGLVYGFPVEDIVTGLSVQYAGATQEVDGRSSASFLSEYCPLTYGYKKIPLKLRLAYSAYNLRAANSLATLYYVVVPCFCPLKGISLYPKISSLWVLPFAYVAFAHRAYSLGEFLWCGGTFLGWCNDQRMWLFKRTSSYSAFFETILKLLGSSQLAFVVTAKVAHEDVSKRYDRELIEFGAASPMFDILATLAMLNLFGSLGAIKKIILDGNQESKVIDQLGLQILLCLVLVAINLPVYQALFFRKDKGKMPTSVTYKSIILALFACTAAMYLNHLFFFLLH